ITARRTAAASALAASYLAPATARHLLVVGCGRVGSLIPEAYRAVRPIEKVQVWDRNVQAARALAATLRTQDIDASVAPDLAGSV
ncbi:ornithine cyclodeaminase family protein, partial [Chryseobacterium sp. SIMBA_029]